MPDKIDGNEAWCMLLLYANGFFYLLKRVKFGLRLNKKAMNQVLKMLMEEEFGTTDVLTLPLCAISDDLNPSGIDFRGCEDDSYLSRGKVITPMDLRRAVSKLSLKELP